MLPRPMMMGWVLVLAIGGWVVPPAPAGDIDGDGVDDALDVCNNTPPGTAVDAEGRPLGDIDRDCETDLEDYALFQQGMTGPLPPLGACCYPDGTCMLVTESDCGGDWQGQGTSCTPNPCIPPNMVLVPAGEFQMGDTFSEGNPREFPVHAVYVDAFYMDTYEVTNQQYAAGLNWAWAQGGLIEVSSGVVYQAGSGTSYPYCDTINSSSYSPITWNGSTFGVVSGKENHPMVQVSWYGAVAYANWRSAMQTRPLSYNLSTWECNFSVNGYRLPTEAEWEKAGRGGTPGHRFPWSDHDTIQHTRANYYSSSFDSYDTSLTRNSHPLWGVGAYVWTSPVGFFTGALQYQADWGWPGTPTSYQTANGANGYGLYDMAGNVSEWCNDWYSSTYYGSSPYDNPHGPTSGTYRVLRGGSWGTSANGCRVANRNYSPPDYRYDYGGGFRLALDSE
ncbi:MAG: SUMF1/EgtB/PvdO family nonheme iron enzyme [Planctomycetota bacterium]